tara:strand:- start:92 stop:1516 length:1425 start_codon:yes stop_codon:yes gene_type:complete
MESPTIIPLSQLESMLGVDVGQSPTHLDAVMASPSHGQPSLPPAPVSPLPLNRPDNAWVRFEAEVRSKHAMALMKLRRLWESGGASDAELHPLLKLLDIEEQTRCQAFQACVMGEERSHVYQAVVRSIIEKLLGKLETHTPSVYQGTVQCLSDYLSALNHHCEICVVPPPPSALPAIAEGSAIGYSASQLTGYSSESASEAARSETRSDAARSEDTLSVCSAVQSAAEGQPALPLGGALGTTTYMVDESRRSSFDGSTSGREADRAERRRESNKKAASRYRSKKSTTMTSLMADNTALRQQMSTLASQSAVLAAENKLLTQQVAFLQKMLTERGGDAAMPLPPPVVTQPSATESEMHHIDMLLDGLSHTADPSLQRAADQAMQELDGSLHPDLHVMAEPEPSIASTSHSSFFGWAGDAHRSPPTPPDRQLKQSNDEEAYHVAARQRTGHALPAEVRCAKAFGCATGADTDMLNY